MTTIEQSEVNKSWIKQRVKEHLDHLTGDGASPSQKEAAQEAQRLNKKYGIGGWTRLGPNRTVALGPRERD
jgi:hypothetical protein